MKFRISTVPALLVATVFALAATSFATNSAAIPDIPRTLSNARFVYVTAYDGDEFDPGLLPEDRAAIARVQEAIDKWGKLIVVYRPQDADIVLAVESRPTEDVLALYDAHNAEVRGGRLSTYLWRVMGRAGLQRSEMPLFTQFQKAWGKITD